MADVDISRINRLANLFDRYGFSAGVAGVLLYILASLVLGKLDTIQTEIHDHVYKSGFYQEISCRNLAILAGRPLADCTPPGQDKATSTTGEKR